MDDKTKQSKKHKWISRFKFIYDLKTQYRLFNVICIIKQKFIVLFFIGTDNEYLDIGYLHLQW